MTMGFEARGQASATDVGCQLAFADIQCSFILTVAASAFVLSEIMWRIFLFLLANNLLILRNYRNNNITPFRMFNSSFVIDIRLLRYSTSLLL